MATVEERKEYEQRLNSDLQPHIVEVLKSFGIKPNKIEGDDLFYINWNTEVGPQGWFKLNLKTQKWTELGTHPEGEGIASFLSYMRNEDRDDIVNELGNYLECLEISKEQLSENN